MIRNLLWTGLSVILVLGCASSPKKQQEALNRFIDNEIRPTDDMERAVYEDVLRKVASVEDEEDESKMDREKAEIFFQKLMSGSDTANREGQKEITKRILDKLNWFTDFYYVAQMQVEEFDKELNKAIEQMKTQKQVEPILHRDIYVKLQIARMINDTYLDYLLYLYNRLLETGSDNSTANKKRAYTANWVLQTINVHFGDTYKKGGAVALINLATHLDEVNAQFSTVLKKRPSSEKPPISFQIPQMKKYMTMSSSQLQNLTRIDMQAPGTGKLRADQKAAIEFREQALSRGLNRKIERLFEEEVPKLKSQMMFDESRSPQQNPPLKVFPSLGGTGNLTGNTFPPGVWALTYDDGPHRTHTVSILNNLQKNKVRATFFWLAQNVKPMSEITQRAGADGHARANHSYSHANLPKLGESALEREVIQSTKEEGLIYGSQPTLFRCPYGACSNRAREMMRDTGIVHVFWNVDTLDWQDKNPKSIYDRSMKQIQANGKGIILFHDIHPQSVEASRMLMENMKGITWVTVPEAITQLNGNVPYASP